VNSYTRPFYPLIIVKLNDVRLLLFRNLYLLKLFIKRLIVNEKIENQLFGIVIAA
jgi:hypothetical protein